MNIVIYCAVVFVSGLSLGLALSTAEAKDNVEGPGPVIERATIILTNNGPGLVGSTVTCFARLVDDDGNDLGAGEYVYIWTDYDEHPSTDASNATTSNYTQSYLKAEKRTVEVSVTNKQNSLFYATNKTFFNVTEHLTGSLEFSQGNNSTNLNKNIFETNQSLEIVANVYDPSGYLENADIVYEWNIADVYQLTTFNQPDIVYNFTMPLQYDVGVNITAFVPGLEFYSKKIGYFTSLIDLKDKISNVLISGSFKVSEGETHNYTVTWEGSLPAYLCSRLHSNSTCEGATDECNPVMQYNHSATIEFRFNDSGTHCLSVNVANDVSNFNVATNIKVKQVLPHQKAIAITVGIVFGVFACFISILLVAQQVKRSRRRHVEVANFDFQEENHNKTFKKFAKNVKNTYKLVSKKVAKDGKEKAEYKPLISM
ncbi:transmembrane protein 130-like [Antedon mediterranea]|uniref:transmembrane protein 130-like n=1 Tax=Antedon mediterranea TaxID=105859 RepID=UPI003AF6705D